MSARIWSRRYPIAGSTPDVPKTSRLASPSRRWTRLFFFHPITATDIATLASVPRILYAGLSLFSGSVILNLPGGSCAFRVNDDNACDVPAPVSKPCASLLGAGSPERTQAWARHESRSKADRPRASVLFFFLLTLAAPAQETPLGHEVVLRFKGRAYSEICSLGQGLLASGYRLQEADDSMIRFRFAAGQKPRLYSLEHTPFESGGELLIAISDNTWFTAGSKVYVYSGPPRSATPIHISITEHGVFVGLDCDGLAYRIARGVLPISESGGK